MSKGASLLEGGVVRYLKSKHQGVNSVDFSPISLKTDLNFGQIREERKKLMTERER
jgi:hypothetical protein